MRKEMFLADSAVPAASVARSLARGGPSGVLPGVPVESRTASRTVWRPAAAYACWAVRAEDHGASQTPSSSQSHRASRVAFGSDGTEEDASNVTVALGCA